MLFCIELKHYNKIFPMTICFVPMLFYIVLKQYHHPLPFPERFVHMLFYIVLKLILRKFCTYIILHSTKTSNNIIPYKSYILFIFSTINIDSEEWQKQL